MGLGPLSDQNKDYKIDIYCFSTKHVTGANTGWLEIKICQNGATCPPTYCCFTEYKNQMSVLIQYKVDIIISSNVTCSRHDMPIRWLEMNERLYLTDMPQTGCC